MPCGQYQRIGNEMLHRSAILGGGCQQSSKGYRTRSQFNGQRKCVLQHRLKSLLLEKQFRRKYRHDDCRHPAEIAFDDFVDHWSILEKAIDEPFAWQIDAIRNFVTYVVERNGMDGFQAT